MLSSTDGGQETCRHNNEANKGLETVSPSSLSSKSSSTSSSCSTFSPFNLYHHQTLKAKTMEEVWKEINLSSLHEHQASAYQDFLPTTTPRVLSHNPNFILQDFLARPFTKDNHPSTITVISTHTDAPPPPPPLLPPAATFLSLNSAPGFHFLDNSDPLRHTSHLQTNPVSFVSSFEVLDSSSGRLPSFAKTKVQESDSSSGDRRHKRKIKNRESAARSRARKQAYANELEQEVSDLAAENARLRRQQAELCLAAAAQAPKKHHLHRTSTAPF